MDLWHNLARLSDNTERGVDFITIDGGEGGTGAGPLVFTDRVALPFKIGMSRVYRVFAERGLHEKIVFQGSAKLGFPEMTLFAFALGCDMVGVAREAMLSIGCIQAQQCHSGHCPTGVATQNRWLVRGLDPLLKADRLANYVMTLRKEVLTLSRACGVVHPALITSEYLEILDGRFGSATVPQLFGYELSYGMPSPEDRAQITELMNGGPGGTATG
jgi:glutamate synthase domain-containing protein 2